MSKKLLGALFVLGAIILLAALPVSANHSWGNYHWARSSNPFTLNLGDNLSADWKPYLATSSSDWSRSSVLDTVVVPGAAGGNCRPGTGHIEVCNAAYGNNGWLGLAQIWVSGDHITKGAAKMNDTYFALPQYNTTAERNHVMCQEVGHLFGLGHQDESGAALGTCMDYSNDDGSQHPNAHDYEQLEIIYAHFDGGGGGGGGNCNGRNPNCNNGSNGDNGVNVDLNNPSEWGQLVRSQGRAAIYERNFGNERLITFVYWA